MEYLEKLETIANTGAPGAIRTPDLRNRNPSLYPAELRVRGGGLDFLKNPRIHVYQRGSSGELKNQELSLLVRESFLPKAIFCHPKGRFFRWMVSASRKWIRFESFKQSIFFLL